MVSLPTLAACIIRRRRTAKPDLARNATNERERAEQSKANNRQETRSPARPGSSIPKKGCPYIHIYTCVSVSTQKLQARKLTFHRRHSIAATAHLPGKQTLPPLRATMSLLPEGSTILLWPPPSDPRTRRAVPREVQAGTPSPRPLRAHGAARRWGRGSAASTGSPFGVKVSCVHVSWLYIIGVRETLWSSTPGLTPDGVQQ